MDDFEYYPGPESEDGLILPPGDAAALDSEQVSYATPADGGVDAHDNLWWYADGTVWDLGPAEFDTDGDGVADSLTSEIDGATAVLTDLDGDGRVDSMSVLYPDGSVAVESFDEARNRWNPTTVGRID